MLVLKRKQWESVVIGQGDSRVEVVIIEIDRNGVRLGIEAPRHVPIYRNEIEPKDRSHTDAQRIVSPVVAAE